MSALYFILSSNKSVRERVLSPIRKLSLGDHRKHHCPKSSYSKGAEEMGQGQQRFRRMSVSKALRTIDVLFDKIKPR